MKTLCFAVLIFMTSLGVTACHTTRKIACAPDVVCTRIFKSVTVRVTDAATKPVQLDDAYTININTGETIRFESTGEVGTYTVLDDSYQKKIQNSTARFQFVGTRNSERITEEYRISADCCHIDKLSGREEIVVK